MIHTDLERGFIRAEVIHWDELLEIGSWSKAKRRRQAARRGQGLRGRRRRRPRDPLQRLTPTSADGLAAARRRGAGVARGRRRPSVAPPRACSGGTASTARCCCRPAGRCTRFGMRLPDRRRLLRPATLVVLRRSHACGRGRLDRAACCGRARVIEAEAGAFERWGLRSGDTARGRGAELTAPGALVLVGTPIGNLGDLSPRAVEALRRGRRSSAARTPGAPAGCSQHAGVARRAAAAPSTTTPRRAPIAEVLGAARRAASGWPSSPTPACPASPTPASGWCGRRSTPGTPVEVVPGPSAAIAALVVERACRPGGSCSRASCPGKGSGRTERLAALAGERRTIVLYEAPHRLARTLADLAAALRRRPAGRASAAS